MIIQLNPSCPEVIQKQILEQLVVRQIAPKLVRTQNQLFVVTQKSISTDECNKIVGKGNLERLFEQTDAHPLCTRGWKREDTQIDLGEGIKIGGGEFQFIAGPCSIEDESQIDSVVTHLKENGIRIMRGGAFKPRTSPYSFKGGGLEALKLFHQIGKASGVRIISEIPEAARIEDMYPYVDIFQVGARNSQNFSLLSALGESKKPVLIKRGISGTIEELLQSAEHIFAAGNQEILLCERGIRTFEHSYRNTLDINAVPFLKEKTHLPIIVDPSHGVGIRRFVAPMAMAAIAAGADGIMVEVHPTPELAKSDADQTLNFSEASDLYFRGRKILEATRSL